MASEGTGNKGQREREGKRERQRQRERGERERERERERKRKRERVKTVLSLLSRALDIVLIVKLVNSLVKHPKSGLLLTMLYKSSYLQLQIS